MNKYYVYKHIRLDTNEPFYIGKGTKYRPYAKNNRNKYWHNIVNKVGYKIEIINSNLSNEEASVIEKQLINLYGRKDLGLGSLVNMTDGGEGTENLPRSEEWRNKISIANKGKKRSEEWKKKLSFFKKGKKLTKEHKDKISKSNKGRKVDEQGKYNMSISKKGKKLSQNHIENISKGKSISILQYSLTNEFLKEWTSILEAAKFLKISRNTIYSSLKGLNSKFIFKYKNEQV